MQKKKSENSIKALVNLYTVVIGAALSIAVAGVIDPGAGLKSVTLAKTLLFIAFISTLFPFFHGALRHLDGAYVENKNPQIRDGALIFDFLLLFLHALGFVVLSLLLSNPGHFAWVLLVLLSVDVVWGIFTHFASSTPGGISAEFRWTAINFVFIAIGLVYLVSQKIYLSPMLDTLPISLLIAFACIIRSGVDYAWCREFYFPK